MAEIIEKKEPKKKDGDPNFQNVAGATRYSPVSFQADIQEAKENDLVREAEEKLFLHNIDIADKHHRLALDLSLDDFLSPKSSEEEK